MKKNIIKGLASALCVLALSSCLKNKNEQPDFSSTTPVIEIPVGSPKGDGSVNSLSTSVKKSTATTDYIFYLNYAASTTRDTPFNVTLSINTALIGNYNAANSDQVVMIPTSAFTMPTSITIPAGQRRVQVPVKFSSALLTVGTTYGLPVTITDASGVVISKNFASVVVKVKVE